MGRFSVTFAFAAIAALVAAGPAMASQCPKLIAQINGAVGNRFDAAAYDAKAKAAEAQQLHSQGKHADSEKVAKEALGKLGVK